MGVWNHYVCLKHNLQLSAAFVVYVFVLGLRLDQAQAQAQAQVGTKSETEPEDWWVTHQKAYEAQWLEAERRTNQTTAWMNQLINEMGQLAIERKRAAAARIPVANGPDQTTPEWDPLLVGPDRSDSSFNVAFVMFLIAAVLSILCGVAIQLRLLDKSPMPDTEHCGAVFAFCFCVCFLYVTGALLIM